MVFFMKINILKKIFSISNDKTSCHKIVEIFGLKLKFKSKFLTLQKDLSKVKKELIKSKKEQKEQITKTKLLLKEQFVKTKLLLKEQKEQFKKLSKNLISIQIMSNFLYANENYKIVLKKIKNKFQQKQKIRVAFLVNENQKWSYQSLYEEFDKSEYFEPLVLVTVDKGAYITINNLEENYNFFKSKNINVDYAYKDGEFLDLQKFQVDIVFYSQPWEIADIQSIVHVSHFALTMYCPYGYQTFDYEKNYMQKFHKLLFSYFVENEHNVKRFERYQAGNSENCVAIGYPKLDIYTKNYDIDASLYWKEPEKFRIIYAPHHSFGNVHTTNIGTFLENGNLILELAKSHPDTTWIFKPHPWFKHNLITRNKIMTTQEYENYIKEWEKIGNIFEDVDYFDIFKTSDLMITDCASFLTEYLPSKKPLIRLSNHNCIKMNDYGEKIISEYYFAYSNEELEKTFNMLVVDRNDPKKEARERLAEEIFDYKNPSATKIYNYILDLFRSKDD